MEQTRSSYRVYTAEDLQTLVPTTLRASAPPPATGVTASGVAFLLGVALAIGGSSWAAMTYVKSDLVPAAASAAAAMDVRAPDALATAAEPAPAPEAASAAPTDPTTTSPTTTSASAKAKPKKRRPKPAGGSASSSDKPPANPYDDLAGIDRAPTSKQP